MIPGILIVLWGGLIYFSWLSGNRFLLFFFFCQFVFLGLGLIVFPLAGKDYLVGVFSSFSWADLDDWHFYYANVLILFGCGITLAFSLLGKLDLVRYLYDRRGISVSVVREPAFISLAFLSAIVGIYFVAENAPAFFSLLSASSSVELSDAYEIRADAVSQYFVTLAVYNLGPAVVVVALVRYLARRTVTSGTLFFLLFFIVAVCLVLTFQKRPFMVYLGCVFLAWKFYGYSCRSVGYDFSLTKLAVRNWHYGLASLCVLVVFYYFYTGFRFESEFSESIYSISEVVGTRVIGRLSLPAAMYIDYFPRVHDYYGLGNVGLFAKVFGHDVFPDTSVVFSHYSLAPVEGSVAASVFIDAYGQAGVFGVAFYGVLLAFILVLIDAAFKRAPLGASKTLLLVFGMVFLYYLSQASLFRSLLGYGGVIYLVVWLACVRKKVLVSEG